MNLFIGLGEIGSVLFEIVHDRYPNTIGIDPQKGHPIMG